MALRVTLFAALALLVPAPAGAAVLESSGDLDAVVAAFESSMPGSGSGGYDQPSQAETSAFATGFDRARAGDYLGAAAVLDPLAFDVVLFTDSTTGRRLTVLAERSQSGAWPHGWGLYVHDPAARTPGLVVQAPHPIFDQRTPALAVRTFDWAGAGTLMVAGTHRNANAAVDARGYRVSDMSHAYDSVFQAVHSRASGPGVRVLQIHGFAQDSLAACRDLVVSGGIAPAPPFASSLASGMVSRNYNVFLYEGQDCGEGLSGTQNAQGPAARQAGADFTHLEIRNYLRTGDALREQLAFDLADVIAGAAAPPPGGGPGGGGSGAGSGGGKIVAGNPWGVPPSEESGAVLGVTDSSDRVAPTLRILGPACRRGACRADAPGYLRIRGRVGDAGGVAKVELAVWGRGWQGKVLAARLSRGGRAWSRRVRVPAGRWWLGARATDHAGNARFAFTRLVVPR